MTSAMEDERIERFFGAQNDNPFADALAPRAEPAASAEETLASGPSHAPRRPRPRRLLPLVLFVLTCFTTVAVGGTWYGLAVMTILVCHEAGHFVQARRYRVPASLPYFIPMPNLIGTMGAVIAMDPRIHNRRALFDIGMTGPLFGLLPTLICCYVGLLTEGRWIARAAIDGQELLELGDPLIFQWMAHAIVGPMPEGHILTIGPIAMAGWVGLLITSLNLIPIGQLDGGHILYAMLGRRAHPVALALLVAAAVGAFTYGYYWWTPMIILLAVFGPTHPPTRSDGIPLGRWRTLLGCCMLAFVIVGFTPNLFVNMPTP